MSDINARFCRLLLQLSMKELTGREAEHFRENASAIRIDRSTFLFEWTNADIWPGRTFTLELQADNVVDAKAQGIIKWLDKCAVALRADGWPPRELKKIDPQVSPAGTAVMSRPVPPGDIL